MIKIEFSKLKQIISTTQHFYVEAWSSMMEDGSILNVRWCNCHPPTPTLGLGFGLGLVLGLGGGQFSLGATVLEPLWIYQEQMEEHIKCRHIM